MKALFTFIIVALASAVAVADTDRSKQPAPGPEPTFTPPVPAPFTANGMQGLLVERHELPIVELMISWASSRERWCPSSRSWIAGPTIIRGSSSPSRGRAG